MSPYINIRLLCRFIGQSSPTYNARIATVERYVDRAIIARGYAYRCDLESWIVTSIISPMERAYQVKRNVGQYLSDQDVEFLTKSIKKRFDTKYPGKII